MSLMFIFFIIYTSYILLLRVYVVCTPVYACCVCEYVYVRVCTCVRVPIRMYRYILYCYNW